MLSLWFIHDTGLMMMIEIMKLMRDELDGAKFCENGEREGTNLEKSQKKPQTSRRIDETKLQAFHSSFLADVGPQGQRRVAAKYRREGEGHSNECWQINKDVVSEVCTDFDDILF